MSDRTQSHPRLRLVFSKTHMQYVHLIIILYSAFKVSNMKKTNLEASTLPFYSLPKCHGVDNHKLK